MAGAIGVGLALAWHGYAEQAQAATAPAKLDPAVVQLEGLTRTVDQLRSAHDQMAQTVSVLQKSQDEAQRASAQQQAVIQRLIEMVSALAKAESARQAAKPAAAPAAAKKKDEVPVAIRHSTREPSRPATEPHAATRAPLPLAARP